MTPRTRRNTAAAARDGLLASIGRDVTRFQEASNAFDDVPAEVLALDRLISRA